MFGQTQIIIVLRIFNSYFTWQKPTIRYELQTEQSLRLRGDFNEFKRDSQLSRILKNEQQGKGFGKSFKKIHAVY